MTDRLVVVYVAHEMRIDPNHLRLPAAGYAGGKRIRRDAELHQPRAFWISPSLAVLFLLTGFIPGCETTEQYKNAQRLREWNDPRILVPNVAPIPPMPVF
jgi:hypothetical protein